MPRILALCLAALVAVGLVASPGTAQVKIPPVQSSPTPSPSPTPTKRLPDPDPEPEPDPDPEPTRTTRPPSGGSGGGSGGSGGSRTTKTTKTGGSGARTSTAARPVPPRRVVGPPSGSAAARGIAAWTTRPKTPAHTTTRLLELIEATQPEGEEASLRERAHAFGRFPVVGYVWYQDDYGAPRWYPSYHPHEGTDLFAKDGTPVIACVDGYIWKWASGGGGGNALWLMGDDGVRYYYGHLKSFAPGMNVLGRRVRMGDLIATVGATGASAVGTYPHVHFEVNPGGLGSVNPKPILDAWLRQAEERAAVAAGLVVAPESFSPARPGRWVAPLELNREARPAGPAPLWTGAFGSGSTATFADLALSDLMTRDDLTVPAMAGDGASLFDPLARLLEAEGGADEHAHND